MTSPILKALRKGIPVTCGGYAATLIAFNPELPAPIMCAVKTGISSIFNGADVPERLMFFDMQGRSLSCMQSDLKIKGWL